MDRWPALVCPADGETLEENPDALSEAHLKTLKGIWCEHGGNGLEARGRTAGTEKAVPAVAA